MKKILLIFGTRPEAIKMLPLFIEFKKYPENVDVAICLSGQHKEMLSPIMNFFGVKEEYNLDVMMKNQTLNSLSARIFQRLPAVLDDFKPDLVLVHGDTTTSFVSSLVSFNHRIKVGHVEAGLRTFNLDSPFPEELNRQLTGKIATHHFAPTEDAFRNLGSEGIVKNVLVTGNTVIDALMMTRNKLLTSNYSSQLTEKSKKWSDCRVVLITAHRRENFGENIVNIASAIRDLSREYSSVQFVYPVHMNPNISEPVHRILADIPNVHLERPLDYPDFVWLMSISKVIISDSGGVQEEAPSLGVPVLVLRDTTERPEALKAGTIRLVGASRIEIIKHFKELMDNEKNYNEMAKRKNPYGDGTASQKIVKYILEK